MPDLITPDELKRISTSMSLTRCNLIAMLLNKICPSYGINTKDIFEEFIAQVLHESGEFTIKAENMNYSTAARIVEIWPSRFNLDGSNGKLKATEFTRNAPRLANSVYAFRMGNGGPESGDGFRYRGGGPMQMTGKYSYELFAKFMNLPLEEVVEAVQNDDEMGIHAACWEFAVNKKLLDEAERDEYKAITKSINGGLIGWNDRVFYYRRAINVLKTGTNIT